LTHNADLFECNEKIPISCTSVFYAKCGTITTLQDSDHTALLPWRQSTARCSALKKILKASDASVTAEKKK